VVESITLDELDRQLIHALNVDGRAPFSRIAEVVGVSDQTVARRYRRMRASGLIRVVGAANAVQFGHVYWLLRLHCTPDAAAAVAAALARREDTFWVHLLSGGTEITCVMQSWTPEDRDDLLLQKLPRTGQVVSVTAHSVLHIFMGDPMIGRPGRRVLTEEQVARLRTAFPAPADGPVTLTEDDRALFETLGRDGRASYADLAAATGWSESTVRRRMEVLRAAGVLYFEVEVSPGTLGYHAEARLWMSVPPADLAAVGEAIARHPEVAFAAATTGTTNLVAAVICKDTGDLYRYLTERIGALEAIRDVETVPVIHTVKRSGAAIPP
jgi:DNA-binding Lrp family transcriptional regulator